MAVYCTNIERNEEDAMARLNYYEAVVKVNGTMTRTSTNAVSASEARKLLESMYGRGTVVGGPTKK